MIGPLRTTHRFVFLLWATVLPLLFAAGLASQHHWPEAVVPQSEDGSHLASKALELDGRKFDVSLLRGEGGTDAAWVAIVPSTALVSPDVLVYWSPNPITSELNEDAQLLGPYHRDTRYRLTNDETDRGYLCLYSAAHRQVLVSLPLKEVQ